MRAAFRDNSEWWLARTLYFTRLQVRHCGHWMPFVASGFGTL